MANKIIANSELLKKSLLDLEMGIGNVSCMVGNLEGMSGLLTDLNEDLMSLQSPLTTNFQIRLQAILNLLNYSYKDLDETLNGMDINFNNLNEIIITGEKQ